MSEQDSMTREQLEAAGWDMYIGEYDFYEFTAHAPDDVSIYSDDKDYFYQTCTAHYRQLQELAALREFKRLVEVAAQKEHTTNDPDIINAIFSIQVMKAYGKVFEESIFGLPTVSESERAE